MQGEVREGGCGIVGSDGGKGRATLPLLSLCNSSHRGAALRPQAGDPVETGTARRGEAGRY